jgi:hypothetical protein
VAVAAACSGLIASHSKPSALASVISARGQTGSLPSRCLIAVSQIEAALTWQRASLSLSSQALLKRASPLSHHIAVDGALAHAKAIDRP